jgi:hypothetical protein
MSNRGAQVEDGLAFGQLGYGGGVAATERHQHRRLGQGFSLDRVVERGPAFACLGLAARALAPTTGSLCRHYCQSRIPHSADGRSHEARRRWSQMWS